MANKKDNSGGGIDTTTILILGAVGVGAYFLITQMGKNNTGAAAPRDPISQILDSSAGIINSITSGLQLFIKPKNSGNTGAADYTPGYGVPIT
ncbi:MAG: hypothetical protein NW207_04815 [Cytophagales bacterium]|nr:hypothetical protein [Cytophagales bacterium]